MNEQPSNREDRIVEAALELPPAQRAAYLDQACGPDARLRQLVEALLRAHRHADAAREPTTPPVPAPGPTITVQLPPTETAGEAIGRYKLLERIGEGGMGSVWMAEQTEPVRRKVALKLIKPGMDSATVLARFEAERQALALMDHPNIAKVLDAGATATGRPYFVMELVKGIPITKFCDGQRLSIRERLDLFLPVCQAIQHAHQKGIIHRDVKPSNVLVALYDGVAVPKVIDFGLAKAMGQQLTERTLFTSLWAVIGTLEYMSPEQAQVNQLDIDTRTDIYSLGVLLYELLTGTTPLTKETLRQEALDAVLRLIREKEAPRPSTRLSETREQLATISVQRRLEPAQLVRQVRGDLDWIVMKALEKDRNRRYETANGLAMDLQRHLSEEPVAARPPSTGYRFAKLVRRNKGAFAATAAVGLTLVLGVVVSMWQAVRADKARRAEAGQRALAEASEKKAIAQKQIAEAVGNFLQQDLLRQADVAFQEHTIRHLDGEFEAKENPTIKELLDRAASKLTPEGIEKRFPGQPEVQASILKTVGDTYTAIGQYDKAVEFLARASHLWHAGAEPDGKEYLAALQSLALAYHKSGNLPKAIKYLEQLRDVFAGSGEADQTTRFVVLNDLAVSYGEAARYQEAAELLEGMRDAFPKHFGDDHQLTLRFWNNLAFAHMNLGKVSQAIERWEHVRDKQAETLGADHPHSLETANNLAMAYLRTGKLDQAIELFERVHKAQVKLPGPDHPHTLITLNNLARAYSRSGQFRKAIELFEIVREASAKKIGPDHPQTLICVEGLAEAYKNAGELTKAISLFEEARDGFIRKAGPEDPLTLLTLNDLAGAYYAANRLSEAAQQFAQVRRIEVEKFGANHPDTLTTTFNLGATYKSAGDLKQALPLLQEAAEGIEKHRFQHQHAQGIVSTLTECLDDLKQFDEAESWSRKWLEVAKEQNGADSTAYAGALASFGTSLLKRQKWVDAESVIRSCLRIREQKLPDDWRTFNTRSLMGASLLGQRKLHEAQPLLLTGYEGMKSREAMIPASLRPARLKEALERLVQLCEAWGKPEQAAEWKRKLTETGSAAP